MDDPGLTVAWLEEQGFSNPGVGTLWWRSICAEPLVQLGVSVHGAWELRQVEDGAEQTVRPSGMVKTRVDVLDLVRMLSRFSVAV